MKNDFYKIGKVKSMQHFEILDLDLSAIWTKRRRDFTDHRGDRPGEILRGHCQ